MTNMNKRAGRGVWFVVLAVLGLACGWLVTQTLAADKDKGAPKTPPTPVQIARGETKTIAPQLSAVGNVIAYQTVALSARLDSQITEIKFKPGQDVTKGMPLFVLDPAGTPRPVNSPADELLSTGA